MDAVYVHIVKNYYAKGLAPWTEEDQLKKIVKNAEKLEPLLIGKTATRYQGIKKGGCASFTSQHQVGFYRPLFLGP